MRHARDYRRSDSSAALSKFGIRRIPHLSFMRGGRFRKQAENAPSQERFSSILRFFKGVNDANPVPDLRGSSERASARVRGATQGRPEAAKTPSSNDRTTIPGWN